MVMADHNANKKDVENREESALDGRENLQSDPLPPPPPVLMKPELFRAAAGSQSLRRCRRRGPLGG